MKKKVLAFAAALAVLPVFLFSHIDGDLITYWAIELLRHIQTGDLRMYAADLYRDGMGINYSLWLDAVIAVWELPLYLIHCLLHLPAHWIIYETWYKILIWLVNIGAALEISRIFSLLGNKDEKSVTAGAFYLISIPVCFYSIGVGQVDCFGIWFFLCSLRLMLEDRQEKAAVFAGLSFLCKSFSLMAIIPLFLLYAKPNRKTARCVSWALLPVVLEKVSTLLLVKDYFIRGNELNKEVFFPRIFAVSINDYPLFPIAVLVVCAVCLYKNITGTAKKTEGILAGGWIFCIFYFLVFCHYQWFCYGAAVLLLVIAVSRHKAYAYFLYLGMNVGAFLRDIVQEEVAAILVIRKAETALGRLSGLTKEVTIGMRFPVPEYTSSVGKALFLACFILIVLLPLLEKKERDVEDSTVMKKTEKGLLILQWIFAAFCFAFSWAVYL